MNNNDELRRAGLKITTPRLKILELLEHTKPHHLSAESIHQQLKAQGDDVGLATVYRVLAQFETANLIRRHQFDGGYSVFELEQGEHHDHLVCERCGLVKEFVDDVIEKRQFEIAERAGFQISEHQHTIYGVCKNCR
ncbi:MAG: transcriptional repressor [Gammaproteobacteria bacterium RIFCSPLOWO2_02_FULL_42_14]|nr:MAG: transcriptional repressor [Gammaproteobacteria bacterium RIFCSPHIGHO2_02_FULL_42_43]OGT28071.1 MAG: transcriptional repressor [Gammaproteobacteria bacterium RIFCSPHIGHO2_01_FULL_42_8]OGT52565.1 MAG: transcriptional repressor [Gammaproteobacteria bacterium RIFCSPHIGHO2_12_FULL_41_25]OGT63163.1 MAG: transcriptional repressor [Gammaproteobacteria bacterium RIFCSPLOWO2_02_FULL_42_14]OGT86663.1 MAG: transcriptional repressor [Gammaproteobacteria bacterium RIFCSPLOWO2_12_FULL_42_18]